MSSQVINPVIYSGFVINMQVSERAPLKTLRFLTWLIWFYRHDVMCSNFAFFIAWLLAADMIKASINCLASYLE